MNKRYLKHVKTKVMLKIIWKVEFLNMTCIAQILEYLDNLRTGVIILQFRESQFIRFNLSIVIFNYFDNEDVAWCIAIRGVLNHKRFAQNTYVPS